MKSKFVLRVLAVSGILALSATVAQAGDGGKPFAMPSFFVCQGINADAPTNNVVDVDLSVFGINPQKVKIGNGVLACVVAKLFPGGSTHVPCGPGEAPPVCNEIAPIPTPLVGSTTQEGLKCYGFSTGRKSATGTSVPNTYIVSDNLFGVDSGVRPSQVVQYICAPANFQIGF